MDLLASEYGWTKDYIMDHVYPDEVPFLVRTIRLRDVEHHIREIEVVSYPNFTKADAKAYRDRLYATRRELSGDPDAPDTLDRAGLNALKKRLSEESRMIKTSS